MRHWPQPHHGGQICCNGANSPLALRVRGRGDPSVPGDTGGHSQRVHETNVGRGGPPDMGELDVVGGKLVGSLRMRLVLSTCTSGAVLPLVLPVVLGQMPKSSWPV